MKGFAQDTQRVCGKARNQIQAAQLPSLSLTSVSGWPPNPHFFSYTTTCLLNPRGSANTPLWFFGGQMLGANILSGGPAQPKEKAPGPPP